MMKTKTKLKRKITGKLKLKNKSKRKSHWCLSPWAACYLFFIFIYLFDSDQKGPYAVTQIKYTQEVQ